MFDWFGFVSAILKPKLLKVSSDLKQLAAHVTALTDLWASLEATAVYTLYLDLATDSLYELICGRRFCAVLL